MATAANKAATPAQVAAWKKRTGHSNATAAEALGVNPRTFNRWLSGESKSPRWLRDRFIGGAK